MLTLIPRIVPSDLTAASNSTLCPRPWKAVMFSWRFSVHLMGRPKRIDRYGITTSSGNRLAFSPNPPPTSGATTRMPSSVRPSRWTRCSRTS